MFLPFRRSTAFSTALPLQAAAVQVSVKLTPSLPALIFATPTLPKLGPVGPEGMIGGGGSGGGTSTSKAPISAPFAPAAAELGTAGSSLGRSDTRWSLVRPLAPLSIAGDAGFR